MAALRQAILEEISEHQAALASCYRRLAELPEQATQAPSEHPAVLDREGVERLVGKTIRWCQLRMADAGFPRGQRLCDSPDFYWRRADIEAWMSSRLREWSGGLVNGVKPPRRGAAQ